MAQRYRFDRKEIAGSLGDLGTLLPLTAGMIMVNHMSVTGTFLTIGLFYILAGFYYGVPVPVQPMKAISAYAIATGMSGAQVSAATGMVSVILFVIGVTGAIDIIGRMIPKPVIRGVQLSTGVLLMKQGLTMIIGNSPLQVSSGMIEPHLSIQTVGPVPVSILLGCLGFLATLYFLPSKRYPAALVVIGGGLLLGFGFGNHADMSAFFPGIFFPEVLPFGLPTGSDLTIALFVLVLPQVPMTVGNAIVANTDLSAEYFGSASKKVTYKTTTLSMAIANTCSFLLGGIPLCHGAGGLAAHYSFGARTGGSNLFIGTVFLVLAFFLGPQALAFINLIPLSLLGVLLVFAGIQLSMAILDMFARKDMFLVVIMLGITLTANLAWSFGIGVLFAYLFRWKRFTPEGC